MNQKPDRSVVGDRVCESVDIPDRRVVNLWNQRQKVGVSTVWGRVYRPADSLNAGLGQFSGVDKPLVSKWIEFVNGNGVRG